MDDEEIKEDQHLLPRFFIKRFAGKNGEVSAFHRPYGRLKSRHPRGMCYKKFAYERNPEKPDNEVENDFSDIETGGAPALNKLSNSLRLNNDEWNAFAQFLSFQLVRGINFYDGTMEIGKRIHEEMIRLYASTLKEDEKKNPETGKSLKQSILDGEIKIEPTNAYFVDTLGMAADGISRSVFEFQRVTVLHAPKSVEFISGDVPAFTHRPGFPRLTQGLGQLGYADTSLVFPVGPKRALLMRKGRPFFDIEPISEEDVLAANRVMAYNCHTWLFGKEEEYVRRAVAETKIERTKPRPLMAFNGPFLNIDPNKQ